MNKFLNSLSGSTPPLTYGKIVITSFTRETFFTLLIYKKNCINWTKVLSSLLNFRPRYAPFEKRSTWLQVCLLFLWFCCVCPQI